MSDPNHKHVALLTPGDHFWREELDDDVELEVTEPTEMKVDLFGRKQWTIHAKRLDTGEEGFLISGPAMVVVWRPV